MVRTNTWGLCSGRTHWTRPLFLWWPALPPIDAPLHTKDFRRECGTELVWADQWPNCQQVPRYSTVGNLRRSFGAWSEYPCWIDNKDWADRGFQFFLAIVWAEEVSGTEAHNVGQWPHDVHANWPTASAQTHHWYSLRSIVLADLSFGSCWCGTGIGTDRHEQVQSQMFHLNWRERIEWSRIYVLWIQYWITLNFNLNHPILRVT